MPTLNAPSQIVFLVSLILAVIAWIGVFAGGIPYIGQHPSILVTLAYVVLAVGCVMKV
jgi:ribose/xylose/arabinose/galactoside ABC-type transport system permease subunit